MKVVIVGGSGNVGTSLIRALADEPQVDQITGVARRQATADFPKTTWVSADIVRCDLTSLFRGADAVVHLAWLIQPSHRPEILRRTNIIGSQRVFQAVADAGVKTVVYASSIGAYSAKTDNNPVDENWPTEGVLTSFYSRHKAQVERLLDTFEQQKPDVRVVRLRKALIFKKGAAAEARRYFLGPLFPSFLIKPGRIPILPHIEGMTLQAVHSHDVGRAYARALTSEVRGPFNIAADPVLDLVKLADLLGARPVKVSPSMLRLGALATWKLHLQPTPPGWLDLGLAAPVMDWSRARTELGWEPLHTSEDAVVELVEGIRRETGLPTPPLRPDTGAFRKDELATGAGQTPGARRATSNR